MTLSEMQLDQVDFYVNAMPLAELMADIPVKSERHKMFVADFYDIVNEVRDKKIAELRLRMSKIDTCETGTLFQRQLQKGRLQRRIDDLLGA